MARLLFGMPSLEQCKELALQYKADKDEKLFLKFLLRFEKLGHYIAYRVQRGCPWIRNEKAEDIKQTILVGILKAFTTITLTESPEYLPLRVSAYVRAELNTTYQYKKLEQDRNTDEPDYYLKDCPSRSYSYPDIDTVVDVWGFTLTKEEKDLLNRKYFLGQQLDEMGKALGLTAFQVDHKVKQIIRKLKKKK